MRTSDTLALSHIQQKFLFYCEYTSDFGIHNNKQIDIGKAECHSLGNFVSEFIDKKIIIYFNCTYKLISMRRYVAIVHHSLDIVMVFKTPRPIYYFDT